MALCTVMAEIACYVVRITDAIEILLMARIAIGWRPGISAGMTIDALKCQVSTRQREIGLIVIKCSRRPCGCIMTLGTIKIKIISHMVGITNVIIILLVA